MFVFLVSPFIFIRLTFFIVFVFFIFPVFVFHIRHLLRHINFCASCSSTSSSSSACFFIFPTQGAFGPVLKCFPSTTCRNSSSTGEGFISSTPTRYLERIIVLMPGIPINFQRLFGNCVTGWGWTLQKSVVFKVENVVRSTSIQTHRALSAWLKTRSSL